MIQVPPAPPRLVATAVSPFLKIESALSTGTIPVKELVPSMAVYEQTGAPLAG